MSNAEWALALGILPFASCYLPSAISFSPWRDEQSQTKPK
jgi:hypothetical protein